MEANTLGIYTPTWTIKFTSFPVPFTKEVRDHLYGILSYYVNGNDRAWKENDVGRSAKIIGPAGRALRDFGREVHVSIDHPQLHLTQKQLWAYEKWAQGIADSVYRELADIYRTDNFEPKLQMCYATPEAKNSEECYRIASNVGDVVRMPCGTLAVITDDFYILYGVCKTVTLHPICGPFRHLRLWLTRRLRRSDEEINSLVKVGEVPLV